MGGDALVASLDDDDDFDFDYSVAVAKVRELEASARSAREVKSAREAKDTDARAVPSSSGRTAKTRSRVHTLLARAGARDGDDAGTSVEAFVDTMKCDSRCVGMRWLEPREENYASPPGFALDPTLGAVMARCGASKLYSHQSAAIDAARSGRSVVVSTPTASGKSLCYVLPIFEAIMDDVKGNKSKALCMFPLKALANDQLVKMTRIVQSAQEMLFEITEEMKTTNPSKTTFTSKEKATFVSTSHPDVDVVRLERLADAKIAVCDGDTDAEIKARIKKQRTQILLTNPDSLHHAMLPAHRSWGKNFWGSLKYIVLDEAHTHTGVSGAHVANVLRRLLRVCASWNSTVRPEFICTSATISNPVEHVRRLTTRTPVCVDESGAPSGRKAILLWQPPEVVNGGKGGGGRNVVALSNGDDGSDGSGTLRQRRSPYAEAADIVADLVQLGIRCLVFVGARTLAETVSRDAKTVLSKTRPELATKVDSYRAGYDQAERRKLERRLQRGEISALVCTSALEMGIDVGALDATVHVGVPETASAMWQQAGRAGRRRGDSVAVIISSERPLDHYYVTRPGELFERQSEEALVDPYNVNILEKHVPCAAKEIAVDLKGEDAVLFTASREGTADAARDCKAPLYLAVKRSLSASKGPRTCVFNPTTKTIECAPGHYPHRKVLLRGAQGGDDWRLVDVASGDVLETIDGHRALSRVYVGCVYLSRKGQFMIQRLDHESRVAHAASYDRYETTSTRERIEVSVVAPDPLQGVSPASSKNVGCSRVFLGDVDVFERVLGYARSDHLTAKVLYEELWKTPIVAAAFRTRAVWFDLPEEVVSRRLAVDELKESTVGVANVCGALVASIAMCDVRDVGSATVLPSVDGGSTARVYLYDNTAGGVGIAETVFEKIESLWQNGLNIVESCRCQSGCPSCVQTGRRAREAGFSRRGAKIVLDGLLGTWLRERDGADKRQRVV